MKILTNALRDIATKIISSIAIISLIICGSFAILKYFGPFSSTTVIRVIHYFTGTNIDLEASNATIGISKDYRALEIGIYELKIRGPKRDVRFPEVKLSFDILDLVRLRYLDSIINIDFAADVEVIKLPESERAEIDKPKLNAVVLINSILDFDSRHHKIIDNLLHNLSLKIINQCSDKKSQQFIYVNHLILNHHDKESASLTGDINIDDDIADFELGFSTKAKDIIEFHGNLNNISLAALNIKNNDLLRILNRLKVSLVIDGVIGKDGLESMRFDLLNYHGMIEKSDDIDRDIIFKTLTLSGVFNTLQGMVIDAIIKTKDITLITNIKKTDDIFKATLQLEETSIENLMSYWPEKLFTATKTWISKNLKRGSVKIDGLIDILPEQVIDIIFKLKDFDMTYIDNLMVPPVKVKRADVSVSSSEVSITLNDASILGSQTNNINAVIDYVDDTKNVILLRGDIKGSLQDLINISFFHGGIENKKLLNFKGVANTFIKIDIPLDKEFVIDEQSLNIKSELSDISHDNLLGLFNISKGAAQAKMIGSKLEIQGSSLLDQEIKPNFLINKDLLSDGPTSIKLDVDTDVSNLKKTRWSVDQIKSGQVVLSSKVDVLNDRYHSRHTINLAAAEVFDSIGIKKKRGEPGIVDFELSGSDYDLIQNIDSYKVVLPNFSSQGSGNLISGKLSSLTSDNSQLNNSNFQFRYQVDADKNTRVILKAKKINLSTLDLVGVLQNTGGTTFKSFIFETDIKYIVLHSGIHLFDPKINLNCLNNTCEHVTIKGRFYDGSKINLFYSHPIVSFIADNAGDTLKALGLYSNMRGGNIELKGSFKADGDFYSKLYIYNYFLDDMPTLLKLLVTLPNFAETKNKISGNDLHFDVLETGIIHTKKKTYVDRFAINGSAFNVEASGVIYDDNRVKGEGVLVPGNFVNSLVRNIPIVGEAISGGANSGIIATNFSVRGNIRDIKFSVNPVSILAPGFVGKIFSAENKFRKREGFPSVEDPKNQ